MRGRFDHVPRGSERASFMVSNPHAGITRWCRFYANERWADSCHSCETLWSPGLVLCQCVVSGRAFKQHRLPHVCRAIGYRRRQQRDGRLRFTTSVEFLGLFPFHDRLRTVSGLFRTSTRASGCVLRLGQHHGRAAHGGCRRNDASTDNKTDGKHHRDDCSYTAADH